MKRFLVFSAMFIIYSFVIYGCGGTSGSVAENEITAKTSLEIYIDNISKENSISYTELKNSIAYIPSMCWTKTLEDDNKTVHNPCYSCHNRGIQPNYLDDSVVQLTYALPDEYRKNPWTNLFVDKSSRVAAMSDTQILDYIRKSNYFSTDGSITLSKKLSAVGWKGYLPDCYFNFDSEGFDKKPDGSYSGWRAFRYMPFLGTFWPTNGATDDVLIRLPETFQQDEKGVFNKEIYKANFAIVEAVLKQRSINTEEINEAAFNMDIDGNGVIGKASYVKYNWNPSASQYMSYAGKAGVSQKEGKIHLAGGLFPEGTEFLHTVRYIDWDDQANSIKLSNRIKEVRYAKKSWWTTYNGLTQLANEKGKEIYLTGESVPETFVGGYEKGLEIRSGWVYQGYIEDKYGELRPQTNEETFFCMGCHSGVGATKDTIYSFGRKFEDKDGWMHWSQKGLKGVKDSMVNVDGYGNQNEYAFYLLQNKAGDEHRGNDEIVSKFFNNDGSIKNDMLDKMKDDITELIFPSKDRALKLNKAYKVIVEDQSYIYGRDANVVPVANVHKTVEKKQLTGVQNSLIILDFFFK